MAQAISDRLDDARAAARDAGLFYVDDSSPGIRRVRAGRGFRYLDPEGRPIRDADEVARLRALAVPPAWTGVWICPSPRGHIQATGRDAKGRKQYRYHPRWRSVRDETKFDRMAAFGEALPRIRARIRRDLRLPGLPRDKVVAAAVSLLDRTFARVGNESYARENGSFGITTLRERHVKVRGSTIRIVFKGKSGKEHALALDDARLAKIVRTCQDLPGQQLFKYVDDEGQHRALTSDDVNTYLRETAGDDFTAKDFRTWAGTVLFARAAREVAASTPGRTKRRRARLAIEGVAAMLGNTPAVCKASYIHPALVQGCEDGTFEQLWERCARARRSGLRADEAVVLAIMRRLARGAPSRPARAA